MRSHHLHQKVQSLVLTIALIGLPSILIAPQSAIAQTVSDQSAEAEQKRKAEGDRLLQQGIEQHKARDYSAALQSCQQALQIYQAIKDRRGEGNALANLGRAYRSLRDYAKAIEYSEQSLAITREVKDQQLEGAVLERLGLVYSTLKNYAKAIDYLEQTLAVYRELKDRLGERRTLGNLGVAYLYFGSYAKAIECQEKSLALSRELKDQAAIIAADSDLGGTYSFLKIKAHELWEQGTQQYQIRQYEAAIQSWQKALQMYGAIKERFWEAKVMGKLADANDILGNHAKANEYREKIVVIARDFKRAFLRTSGKEELYSDLGLFFQQQNQPELAIIFYKKSVNEYEAFRQRLIAVISREGREIYTQYAAGTYLTLADLLLQQNRIVEAMRVLDLLRVQDLQNFTTAPKHNGYTADESIELLRDETNIAFGFIGLIEQRVGEPELKDFITDAEGNTFTARGRRLDPREVASAKAFQTSQRRALEAFPEHPAIKPLVKTLQQTAADQSLTLPYYQDLQTRIKKLGKNIALFYPLILDDRLELVILTNNRPPIHKSVPISRQQLETEIQTFRQQLQARSPLIKQPAQQLYQRLIQPIEAELKTAGVDTLVYAPDSIMRYVPLAALHDGEQWLAQRYQINYLTALALTPLDPDKNPKPRILAGALTEKSQVTILGKTYDFPALQFTQPEVENLAKLLPNTTTLIDKTFNRTSLSTGIPQYTILHLATHGLFIPDSPDQSIILLGDGKPISLQEIEQQWKFPNVSLVVLSACETAIGGKLGSGVEIMGFGYQMQRTGSRASISSLWTVDDGGTQGFMNAFYTALKQGKTPAAAMQQAQQDFLTGKVTPQDLQQLRASGGRYVEGGIPVDLTHPYYWAPFILIGNGL